MQSYDTNMLLSHARLPYHFWSALNPDKDSKDNPGVSIISWIVAKTLTQESSELPKYLSENFKKILEFSNQREKACELLKLRVKSMITVLENYSGDNRLRNLIIQSRINLDSIKLKLSEITMKLASDDKSYFVLNGELIWCKIELDYLKGLLNESGVLLEWEK